LTVSQHNTFLRRGFVSTSPNPQAEGPPLVGRPRMLIQYIRSYHRYRWPFLHPQSEDAPCRGDRDPLITIIIIIIIISSTLLRFQDSSEIFNPSEICCTGPMTGSSKLLQGKITEKNEERLYASYIIWVGRFHPFIVTNAPRDSRCIALLHF
jgi:hypothetical protein